MASSHIAQLQTTVYSPCNMSDDGEKKSSVIRSIRFRADHEEAIEAKAQSMGLDFSTFVRQCALKGAGVAQKEVAKVRKLAATLERVGRTS